jgi:hypothetical protein
MVAKLPERMPFSRSVAVNWIDPKKNMLAIENRDGEQISYNPAQLRQQTRQSTIYREELRDLAVGERNRKDEHARQ